MVHGKTGSKKVRGREGKVGYVPLLKKFHPHTLRHACATLLRRKGVPLRIVQKILGHSSIKTTEIYDTVALYDVLHAFREREII